MVIATPAPSSSVHVPMAAFETNVVKFNDVTPLPFSSLQTSANISPVILRYWDTLKFTDNDCVHVPVTA